MELAIIIGVVVILFVVFILASYIKAPTDRALIVSGLRKNPKFVIGKSALRIPFLQRVDKLELKMISVDVKTKESVPTNEYINVNIDSAVKIKVGSSKEMLEKAASNFLNKNEDYIRNSVGDVLEGNVREIIGQMRLEDIVQDRKMFAEKVQENAAPDMARMGLEIVSFNVQNVTDEGNVIENLGIDRVVSISKSAQISRAESERDIAVAKANATKQANDARIEAETAIAERNNELEIKKQELKRAADVKKAEADAAYEIQQQEQRKTIEITTADANIAKQEKEIELREKEIAVKEKTLDADIRKQAEAEKYATQQKADAQLYQRQKEAEAKQFEIQKQAEAKKAQAEADRFAKEQEAEAVQSEGNNQSEEGSESDVNDQPSDIHVEPPVIHGISDKTYYIGSKVSYMTDVYATDFSGQEIDVEVDKSQVNTSQPGSYIVYYKAVDSDGNETIEEATFTFIEEETQEVKVNSSYSTLDEVVAAVLQDITDNSMSKGQKARAIYKYAHTKIGYAGNSYTQSSEWQDEAFEALKVIKKNGYVSGDCFTYASVDRALLEGIGAECIWVDNQGARSGDHSWVLCNLGTGWYHFDSTRMYDGFECFMLTDSQVQDYINRGNSIYRRDMSAYPATPSEEFSY